MASVNPEKDVEMQKNPVRKDEELNDKKKTELKFSTLTAREWIRKKKALGIKGLKAGDAGLSEMAKKGRELAEELEEKQEKASKKYEEFLDYYQNFVFSFYNYNEEGLGDSGGYKSKSVISKIFTSTANFFTRMDGYGGAGGGAEEEYDPANFPKTSEGGLIWSMFAILVIVLVINCFIAIADNTTSLLTGNDIVFNVNIQGDDTDGSMLDIPTLDFNIKSTIIFYEKDAPSIQGISVSDQTGYNPAYVSTTSKIPVAKSMFETKTIKINTWDPSTQVIPSDPKLVNLDSATVDDSPHTFAESLKVFYETAHVYDGSSILYNSTANLYVRFDPIQLANVKMCQVQIQLFNMGVYQALSKLQAMDSRNYQSAANFPSFTTIPDTYAPSYFNYDTVNWNLKNPEKNLFVLKKHFSVDEITSFATSKEWGPDKIDISSVSDLEVHFGADDLVHIDDYLNWGFSVSYVNNMKTTYESVSCDGTSDYVLTYAEGNTIDDKANKITLRTTHLSDFEFPIIGHPPFYVMISTSVDNEQVLVTNVTQACPTCNVTLSLVRGKKNDQGLSEDPKNMTWTDAPFHCDSNLFPQDTPSSWFCDSSTYWNGDGCDCDCGAYDPDCCLQLGSETKNCFPGEVCSLKGNCVNIVVEDTNLAYISEACQVLNAAGNVDLLGFTGDYEDFASMDPLGLCQPCLDDDHYDGTAQLTIESNLVCEYETVAYISGYENFRLIDDPLVPYSSFVVYFPTAPFPFPKHGKYLVEVATNDGVQETLYLINASLPFAGTAGNFQSITLQTKNLQKPTQRFAEFGRIISALTTDSTTLVIEKHPLDPQFSIHFFSDHGPYQIRVNDNAVIVADSSSVSNGVLQVLKLQNKVAFSFGYITQLQREAKRGDTKIYVQPFNWWFDSLVANASRPFPSVFPLVIRGVTDYVGVEKATTTSYDAPTWTCNPDYYWANDGCDCNCGIADPDCLYPSPASYNGITWDSSVDIVKYCENSYTLPADISNCEACPYCSYSNDTGPFICTSTKSTNNTLISTLFSDYYQIIYLSAPLMMDHAVGMNVETPISIPVHPQTPFPDFDTDIDVFGVSSYITAKRVLDTSEHSPLDRYLAFAPENFVSPDALDIDVALFLIPDKKSFSEVNLCPSISQDSLIAPVFKDNGWDMWTTSVNYTVSDCLWNPSDFSLLSSKNCVDFNKLELGVPFNEYCLKQMPPTHEFSFTIKDQANNKWIWDDQVGVSTKNAPEYLIDFIQTYYFDHDGTLDAVEDIFSAGSKPGGDIDSRNKKHVFYGQFDNSGGGADPNSNIVSNIPYLAPTIYFSINENAAQQILDWGVEGYQNILGKIPFTETDISRPSLQTVKKILDTFPIVNITFNFDQIGGSTSRQYVQLIPGYTYFLEAKVKFDAIYEMNKFGLGPYIAGWDVFVVETKVSTSPLDWFSRSQTQVRYIVKIDDSAKQVIKTFNNDWNGLYVGIGAALALFGVGSGFVAFIQTYICCWRIRKQTKIKDEQDEDEFKETLDHINRKEQIKMEDFDGGMTAGVRKKEL